MFRPPKPKQQQKYYRTAASIPVRKLKKKRLVPVCRRKYPTIPNIDDTCKILDSWSLLQLANAKYPENVTKINGEGIGFTHVVNDDFHYFNSIQSIELSDNNIVLSDILLFPKLQSLHLNCNGIEDIPDLSHEYVKNPSFPKRLTKLSLAFNKLTTRSILNICNVFQSLVSLDLSNNSLMFIPSQVTSLKNLNNFNLSNNKLRGFAVWNILANMPKLCELDLSYNELVMIPDINDYQSIYHDNQQIFFPDLEYINLKNNRIENPDDILPIQNYRKISMIDIRSNSFLNEIWSSIKDRTIAAKNSQMERYDNVLIPMEQDDTNKIQKKRTDEELAELPRPCDFGAIYWEIVLSRGIICVVDDPSGQNVFELQPVVTTQTVSKEFNAAHGIDDGLSRNESERSHSWNDKMQELDTNVFSLLQTPIGDAKSNQIVKQCITEITRILNKK